jgi:NADH-quinone oxidoreductase subunit D
MGFMTFALRTFGMSLRPKLGQGRQIRGISLNFGPQHPAAHGILRLTLQSSGELVHRADPQFGLLHRGTEKLIEHRGYLQALPYFDRFDYVANLFQEHAYCLAVESLKHSPVNLGTGLVRIAFDEISRILNHLLTLSAVSMDLGAMGPIFWAFEERERLMELLERASGARMHTALYRPGSVDTSGLGPQFYADLGSFLTRCGRSLGGAFLGLLGSRVFKTRMSGVGAFSGSKLQNYGITGILARSGGLSRDLRMGRRGGYGAYWYVSVRSFLGRRGDNWDRFLIRIKEVVEGFRLLSQVISTQAPSRPSLSQGQAPISPRVSGLAWARSSGGYLGLSCRSSFMASLPRVGASVGAPMPGLMSMPQPSILSVGQGSRHSKFTGMEELIGHFAEASGGIGVGPGLAYASVESPKGEVGVTLVADGSSRPYRMKLRTPVAHNLQLLPSACGGVTLADFVATFCSLDVVLGEIDR